MWLNRTCYQEEGINEKSDLKVIKVNYNGQRIEDLIEALVRRAAIFLDYVKRYSLSKASQQKRPKKLEENNLKLKLINAKQSFFYTMLKYNF